MEWTHSEHIDASPEAVWALATAVTDWPAYMPTVRSVERLDDGPLRLGASARIKQPGQPRAVWTVTRFEPGRTFTWESPAVGTPSRAATRSRATARGRSTPSGSR